MTYTVARDTHIVFSGALDTADTLLHDENLQPAKEYEYTAYRLLHGKKLQPQINAKTTTMDTTSHNFTWDVYTFGEKGTSIFNAVDIINEDDIWVAGELYTKDVYTQDSSGNQIDPYSGAHWDGKNWELKRFYTLKNGTKSIILPLRDIKVLNNKIWLAAGSILLLNSGDIFNLVYQRDIDTPELVLKLWFKDYTTIYGVGNYGVIVKYNGSKWKKLTSRTIGYINDICGIIDPLSGEQYFLPFQRELNSIWFKNRNNIFLCGDGVFTRNRKRIYKEVKGLPALYTASIRGNDINDVYAVGSFGVINHFNGKTWFTLPISISGAFYKVAVKGNLIVAVGIQNNQAVIYQIRHLNN